MPKTWGCAQKIENGPRQAGSTMQLAGDERRGERERKYGRIEARVSRGDPMVGRPNDESVWQ